MDALRVSITTEWPEESSSDDSDDLEGISLPRSQAIPVFAPGRSPLANFLLRSNIPVRAVYNRETGAMRALGGGNVLLL
jgi:hypothetical protein